MASPLIPPNIVGIKIAYADLKSKEESTGVEKKKFKLAGKHVQSLDIYPFFIIHGDEGALISKLVITIQKNDWENRKTGELHYDVSYIDISDCVVHTLEEIVAKRDDIENGFYSVAKLKDEKYELLKKLTKRFREFNIQVRLDRKTRKITCLALEIPDEIMLKMGLL